MGESSLEINYEFNRLGQATNLKLKGGREFPRIKDEPVEKHSIEKKKSFFEEFKENINDFGTGLAIVFGVLAIGAAIIAGSIAIGAGVASAVTEAYTLATAWKDTIVGEKTEDETLKKRVLTVGLSTFAVTTGVALLGGFGIIGTLQSKAVELGKEAIDLFRNVGNVKIPIGFNGEALLGISIGSVTDVALGIAGAGIAYGIVSEGIELANAISLMNKMQGESGNRDNSKEQNNSEEDAKTYKKYDPKEIEKKYGLKKGEFHRDIKPEILKELTGKNSPYKDLMKKMGNNPDIYLSSNGDIQIVSTQFKGKSFITDLNINDFLP